MGKRIGVIAASPTSHFGTADQEAAGQPDKGGQFGGKSHSGRSGVDPSGDLKFHG